MVVKYHTHTANDMALTDKSKHAAVNGIPLIYALKPVIVFLVATIQSGNNELPTLICDGIARKMLASEDENARNSVGDIIYGYYIATLHLTLEQTTVAEQSVVAASAESVAPTVHHYAVTLMKFRLQCRSSYHIHCCDQSTE